MKTRSLGLGIATAVLVSGCFTWMDFHGASGAGGEGGAGGSCSPGDVVSCYDGPEGTEGKGICTAGSKTCAADGAAFGPCVGAVEPRPENCATPVDDDCDGLAPACKGDPLWGKRFGDAGSQGAWSIATDPKGNVLVTGYVSGAIDFGSGPLISAGGGDIFVAKLDPSGAPVWSRRFGDGAAQAGLSIVADSAANVFVTGYLNGAVDFGNGALTSAGNSDGFLVKLDADGTTLWSQIFGGTSYDAGQSLAVDSNGNVVVTGYFSGTIDLGGGPLSSAGGTDVFLAKLDPDGKHIWSKRFGDAMFQGGQSVAVGGAGDVFVTGNFKGTIDFGGDVLASAGGKDAFVAKLDAAGNHVWSKRFGDAATQYGQGIAVDGAGNVFVVGDFNGTVSFGGPVLSSGAAAELFVAKLDASGNYLWSKRFGDADTSGAGVAVDLVGNVLVAGRFEGTIDFGGGPLASLGVGDVFVAKLDTDGGHLWSKRFGNASDEAAAGVATDSAGNVLVAGHFDGAIDFGGGPLNNAGGGDVFVVKLAP
jgi:hypothetical protein